MPKMKFNTRVKYKDHIYKGLEQFDVDELDVEELQSKGGVLIIDKETRQAQDTSNPDIEHKHEETAKRKKKAVGD